MLDKWFLPSNVYPDETYPDYLSGQAYVMSGNITHKLLKTIDEYSGYVLDIDDAFVTGVIAKKARIKRFSIKLIAIMNCLHTNVCPFHKKAVIYECSDKNQTEEFWSEWKGTPYEKCFPNETVLTTSKSTKRQTTQLTTQATVVLFCVLFSLFQRRCL